MSAFALGAALVVFAAAAAPLARLVATRPFRRKLRSFPRTAVALLALVVGGFTAVLVAAWVAPGVLGIAALGVAGGLVALGWRARPDYGRSRRLPPGSLGLLPIGPLVDDRFFLRQAARHGPVFKTSQFARPMACVVGLPRIVEVLRRYDDVLAPPALPFDAFVPGGFVRSMAAAPHDAYAAVLHPLTAKDVLAAHEPAIAATVRGALTALAAGDGAVGIAPGPPLRALLFTILMRVLFGITAEDPELPRLRALYGVIDVRRSSGALRHRARPALDAITTIVRRRAAAPSLVAAIATARAGADTDPAVLGNLIYLVQNARDDTAGLLVWVLKMLADHPAWARALATTAEPEDLANRIVLETLRLEQSEFLFRRVLAPITIGDFVVPRGWLLRLCIRESHRDPAVFAAPECFDPDRFRRSVSRQEYSPFGVASSRHACLGEQLTRTVARCVLVELARAFTWWAVADGPREFDGWHWTPSRRFRIALTPRAVADPV